jgi:hypothetical protein
MLLLEQEEQVGSSAVMIPEEVTIAEDSSRISQGKSARQQRLAELKQSAYFRKRELVRLASPPETEQTNHDGKVPTTTTAHPGHHPVLP